MADFLIAYRDFERQRGHKVRTMDYIVLRRVLKLGKSRTDVDLNLFGRAYADFHVVGAAHVVQNVVGKVVAGNLYAFVADDASQRDNGDLGCSAAYIYDHVSFWGFYVKPYAESCRHGFIEHVDVAAVGVL